MRYLAASTYILCGKSGSYRIGLVPIWYHYYHAYLNSKYVTAKKYQFIEENLEVKFPMIFKIQKPYIIL